jgi:hypothetical protein
MARNAPDEERNQSVSRSGVPQLNNGPSGGCGGDAKAMRGRRQLAIQEFDSLQPFRLGQPRPLANAWPLDFGREVHRWPRAGAAAAAGSAARSGLGIERLAIGGVAPPGRTQLIGARRRFGGFTDRGGAHRRRARRVGGVASGSLVLL